MLTRLLNWLQLAALLLANGVFARAQQPFYTDDAHVADLHHWHLESNNEFDFLPGGSFPNLRQDAQTIKFSVGAFRQCEVGMDFPLIIIFNHPGYGLGTPIGLGDVDFSIKYRLHEEKEGSRVPAFTVSLNLEPPTGNPKKQLGSGLMDYYLNWIVEKTLTKKLTLRLNGGATFAGNTLTGAVGIKTRGTILTGGASLVRQFTPKLDLGVEVTSGFTSNLQLGRGQLTEQVGGNYELKKNLTLDFGFVSGQAVGSPRWGYQLGFSKDF